MLRHQPTAADLFVDVGRREGNVAEPSSDCIDIYSGAKEMGCRRVSDAMRADTLLGERWEFVDNSFDVSFYKIVDSESSCRLPTTVEEETFR